MHRRILFEGAPKDNKKLRNEKEGANERGIWNGTRVKGSPMEQIYPVMSIYGGMVRKAHNLLHDFATQISRLNETEAAAELQRLYTCLSNTLQSRLAQGMLGRLLPVPEHRSFL